MKVNLRKAAAIQSNIKNYLSDLDLKPTANVDLDLQAATSAILEQQEKLKAYLQLHTDVMRIYGNIREMVAQANVKSGVSALLAKEYVVKQQVAILNRLKNHETTPEKRAIAQFIERTLKSEDSYRYGGRDFTFPISILSEQVKEDSVNKLVELKRELNNINEQVLALNVKTEIDIDEKDYQYLYKLGIV